MRKLWPLFLIGVIVAVVWAQTAPSGYTTNYRFRKWASGANPSADSLNANWTNIDTYIRTPGYTKQDSVIVGGATATPTTGYRFYLSSNGWIAGSLKVDTLNGNTVTVGYHQATDSIMVGNNGGYGGVLKIMDASQDGYYARFHNSEPWSGSHTYTLPEADGAMALISGGTTVISDTSAFTTTATRKAIYISGLTSTSKFTASPRVLAGPGNEALPSTNDLLECASKTDSLIVLRPASGTSGLKFTYIGVK